MLDLIFHANTTFMILYRINIATLAKAYQILQTPKRKPPRSSSTSWRYNTMCKPYSYTANILIRNQHNVFHSPFYPATLANYSEKTSNNSNIISSFVHRYLLFAHLSRAPSLLDHECFPVDMNLLVDYLWICTYWLNTCKHTVAKCWCMVVECYLVCIVV
jgi:hypothetical protein